MRPLRLALVAMALLAPLGALGASAVTEDPLERQVIEVARELRCAVCQSQPVSESNSDLARDMRAVIREQLQAGRSAAEIKQYFVDRYGDYVLMTPPYRGPGAVLWLLPIALFAVLAVAAAVFLRQHRRSELPPPPPLSPEDSARVRAECERER